MQKTIRTIIAGLAAMQCLTAAAQLGDPREKLSITAEVDGATNTDYHWETTDGHLLENGRLRQGVNARLKANVRLIGSQRFSLAFNPFYNFSTRSLKANDDGPKLDMPIPDAHHHYGGGLMATYNTKWLGKPFTLTGTITGNFSQYGYENFSAMAGALFTITRNRSTYLALGGLLLVGTSISWPLFPLIVYNHRFDDHWSISCLETNNYLYYQASPKLRCALGMEIVTDKIFIRPKREDLPEKIVLAVKFAECSVAELCRQMAADSAENPSFLEKETVGSHSVAYRAASDLASSWSSRIRDVIYLYLAHTGLLYRGAILQFKL